MPFLTPNQRCQALKSDSSDYTKISYRKQIQRQHVTEIFDKYQ